MDKKAFGERLANLRIARGIKSSAAMTRQGIKGLNEGDNQKYWGYEQGKNIPSYDVLIGLCRFFGVSSDYMLGLNREMLPGVESIEETTGLTQASIAALHRMKQEGGDEIVCIVNQLLSMIGFYWAMSDIGNAKYINDRMNVPLSGESGDKAVSAKLMLDMVNKSQHSTKSVVVDGKFARDAYIRRAAETMRALFEGIVESTTQEETNY